MRAWVGLCIALAFLGLGLLGFIHAGAAQGCADQGDLDGDGIGNACDPETIVSSDASLPADEYTFQSLVITNNATVTVQSTISSPLHLSAAQITIETGSSLSSDGKGFLPDQGPGKGAGVANDGAGGAGHGGTGGKGWNQTAHALSIAGGPAYDNLFNPTTSGSGGGTANSQFAEDNLGFGGPGGGTIILTVAGTLDVDGVLSSNGLNGVHKEGGMTCCKYFLSGGGGSGGSLLVTATIVTGNGLIAARGGDGAGGTGSGAGGGAGGRIAIYADSTGFAGTIAASGGYGGPGSLGAGASGGAGTVFLKSAAQPYGSLIIDNGNVMGAETPLGGGIDVFDAVTVRNAAHLRILEGQVVTVTDALVYGQGLIVNEGTLAIQDLVLTNGTVSQDKGNMSIAGADVQDDGVLLVNHQLVATAITVHAGGLITHAAQDADFFIVADTLQIAAGGSVDASGKGFPADQGIGAGVPDLGIAGGAGGAGHGGIGGSGWDPETMSFMDGGTPYGTALLPQDFGSGGGSSFHPLAYNADGHAIGGPGGGAIRLIIATLLRVDGTLSSNGTNGANPVQWQSLEGSPLDKTSGGGAGGSLFIVTKELSGTGTIRADGGIGGSGQYGAGGGAGGRIAIYQENSTFSGVMGAAGGQGGAGTFGGGTSAGAGTVLVLTGFIVTTVSLPTLLLGSFTSQQLDATGGVPPVTWSLLNGTLPAGMALHPDGVLNGTPSEGGTFPLNVQATDAIGKTAEASLALPVHLTLPAPNLYLTKWGTKAVPGRILDYFIVVNNLDPVPAQNVSVVELLDPLLFSLVSTSPLATIVDSTTSLHLVTWTLPSLEPLAPQVLSYAAELNASTPVGVEVVGGPVCAALNPADLGLSPFPFAACTPFLGPLQFGIAAMGPSAVVSGSAFCSGDHKGYDFDLAGDPPGPSTLFSTVYAGEIVLILDDWGGYGKAIWIKSATPDGTPFVTSYGHVNLGINPLTQLPWQQGESVGAGDILGTLVDYPPSNPPPPGQPNGDHLDVKMFWWPAGGLDDLAGSGWMNGAFDFDYHTVGQPTDCGPGYDHNNGVQGTIAACLEKAGAVCDSFEDIVAASLDPNEKETTNGKFVPPGEPLDYVIHFENIGNTSALDVFIEDALASELNASTVQVLLKNGTLVPLPEGGTVVLFAQEKNQTVNVGNVTINITIAENWTVTLQDHLLRWSLLGIDLPVNGTDNVVFSVLPAASLPDGTAVQNNATIQFEIFEPLTTNSTLTVIDGLPPSCTMGPLPAVTNDPNVTITWNGSDPVGEIDAFTVFVSENGGGFAPLINATGETSFTLKGTPGTLYDFICIATDTAGNAEVQEPAAEASVYINSPPVITSAPDISTPADAPYTYDVQAEDPDNDTLAYSLLQGPSGMAIDPSTGLISWVADVALPAAGPFTFTFPGMTGTAVGVGSLTVNVSVQVADPFGATASQHYTITVGIAGPTRLWSV